MARETFQTRLKRAMESAGLKQVDLVRIAAERGAKLGKSQVSQYVSGKVTPRRDVMELLAGVLGVTPQWLMGAADTMPDDVAPADVAPEAAAPQAPSASRQKTTDQGSVTMREFKKSNKLDNVLYDVRGPVVDEAARMEEDGAHILKLNIGNPAPFGFRAPTRWSTTCASSLRTARATRTPAASLPRARPSCSTPSCATSPTWT